MPFEFVLGFKEYAQTHSEVGEPTSELRQLGDAFSYQFTRNGLLVWSKDGNEVKFFQQTLPRSARSVSGLAIDISNHQRELRAETIALWKEQGIRKVTVRASTEKPEWISITHQQLQACLDADLAVEAYLWLYFDDEWSPEEQVKMGLDCIKGFPVRRLWIDCEDKSKLGPTETLSRIRRAVQACEGFPCGIYTRRSWWQSVTGNSEALKDLPLWDAQHNGEATLDDFVLYGGWQRPIMKQYEGDVQFCGVRVDKDVFEE